ncbi:hypothetical protein DSO57_1003181 [Entomophthora muscae]|uniref:Uncharacterized protein n=1 Tax=Entomophthora muscae TaxID=34485 RepID=A0ACC2SAD9_9FUNG|nr:hypothetical protein DSO57_1003181 [Entomophthora muscae]
MGNITITHPHLMDPEWENRLSGDKQHPRFETSPLNAVDEIIWQLNNHPPNTITILALGPLTNIAMVIEKDPGVLKKAKKIVSMGGAIFAPGNVSPLAEFNFYADPHAASVVIKATKGGAVPLVLVPLDITHTSYLFQDFVVARLGSVNEPLAEMFLNMLRDGFKFTAELDGLDAVALHDPLAAAIALGLVHPEMNKLAVHVECESTLTYGACVVDRRFNPPPPLTDKDPHVNVCLTFPEPEKFQAKLLDAIFPPKPVP